MPETETPDRRMKSLCATTVHCYPSNGSPNALLSGAMIREASRNIPRIRGFGIGSPGGLNNIGSSRHVCPYLLQLFTNVELFVHVFEFHRLCRITARMKSTAAGTLQHKELARQHAERTFLTESSNQGFRVK